MGVAEDSEPPLKRVKGPLEESKSLPEDHSTTKSVSCSLGDQMARPLTSQGDGETIGSQGVIRKAEFIKIITRALYSLGYDKSGALLEEESGIPLHSSVVNLFMGQVTNGKWDDSVATLRTIGLSDEIMKSASFLILEQKFLELLKMEKVAAALDTLRNEIVPLHVNLDCVHKLASCIISPSQCIRLGISSQDTEGTKSGSKILEKLQKLLPAAIMIPEKRLEHLVERALDVQREACVFHNTSDSDLSLYSDHQCGKNQIPSQTLQILEAHKNEVWFVQFSHNGKYLGSSSKDHSAIIWEVKENGQVLLKHTLCGHQKPVLIVSWSPDDSQILTCGQDEVIRRWDVSSGECLHVYEKTGVGLISCGWFPDGRGIFAGMTDKSICLWDLDGRDLECWKGQRTLRISDMAITDDGKRIISVCRESAILLLDREAKFDRLIEEVDMITSFSLSKDNKFLLVNLMNQEIHLWSIEGDPKLISEYKGHKRTRFVIRSCFGGLDQSFIASGSEDSQVYIWHRCSGELLLALPGHSGAVNCVSWNPGNLHMLASASDDGTIRIWGLDRFNLKGGEQSNGSNHHCNGRS
ncbi:WD repeat-containing protein 26 homolog [Gossypium raimondii]|uniref:CTLH domain-containing protein n=1 Tax=Gossypium raimondii TaxID=29730 RepID=A0A0D2TUZ1_GOSRA|nr:WD repeat-containing protein 26 homolog [Gossypium raimondii]XP_012435948.1 WD repeat-containing protein 26 homolog [Gossypium raimondii]XP_012435949.1 WD repeat-containing protein 26 homolog [Gossypium raimondii]XP_012435953.1 WD repeat-containing protein 26 homolog [Gossypium raimondii]XP_012435956.1 WD repeat-containing protein 26 homolog [Gossypium raimondii]XP_012435957.1 WD repeat-containing protein 26 homolog [Gossypium raimondii]XP_012435960.1 WD repeat-containing protein 26 homolo